MPRAVIRVSVVALLVVAFALTAVPVIEARDLSVSRIHSAPSQWLGSLWNWVAKIVASDPEPEPKPVPVDPRPRKPGDGQQPHHGSCIDPMGNPTTCQM